MKKVEKQHLGEFVHALFLELKYKTWVDVIPSFQRDRWYSLIVELDRVGSSIDTLKQLGSHIYSRLVFRCIEAPRHDSTGELLVILIMQIPFGLALYFVRQRFPQHVERAA